MKKMSMINAFFDPSDKDRANLFCECPICLTAINISHLHDLIKDGHIVKTNCKHCELKLYIKKIVNLS